MIKINRQGLLLNSETALIPAQGSSNVKVEVNNDDTYTDYAIVPYVGWVKNNTVFSCACVYENSSFYIPSGAFARSGIIYISLALVKNNEKLKTQSITFTVSIAPNFEIELKNNDNWDSVVSSLVTNLFLNRFESEIEEIIKKAEMLSDEVEDSQILLNNAIENMGQHEWSGTSIRFKKGDGTWGEWKEIAGEFAKQDDVKKISDAFGSVTTLTKQLFLLMHPVGCIYMSTSSVSPQITFGGSWTRWGNGRVPVGVSSADNDFNTVEKTGGEKTHVLTTQELAEHYHEPAASLPVVMHKQTPTVTETSFSLVYDSTERNQFYEDEECSGMKAGGNQAHNNLQPYITCYMWKRTA